MRTRTKVVALAIMMAGLLSQACNSKEGGNNSVDAMSGQGADSTVSDGVGTEVDTIKAIDKEAEDSLMAQPAP